MKKITTCLLLIAALTVSSVVAASFTQESKDINLSISSSANIDREINKIIQETETQPLYISYKNQRLETNYQELGISTEIEPYTTTTDRISNIASTFTKQKNYRLSQKIKYDFNKVEQIIIKAFNLNPKPIEPTLIFNDPEFQVKPGQNGYSIKNKTELASFLNLSSASKFEIELNQHQPKTSSSAILAHKETLNQFQPQDLTLTYEEGRHNYIHKVSKSDIQIDSNGQIKLNPDSQAALIDILKGKVESAREDLEIIKINPETKDLEIKGNLIHGVQINQTELVNKITTALNAPDLEIEIPVIINHAKVVNKFDSTPYTLLGQGISNYTGSGAGRAHNIQFASNERYKSILVPKGEKFQFNTYLGGPVTLSRGWKNAYVISGGEIVPAPGGGICQMSTTFYRAALYSGLQIDKKSNHSLYVHYYTAYGDGLDAAIFPGSKDLHFTNNTPDNIILHSRYTDAQDLIVSVIGVQDGRQVTLNGPYTAGDNDSNPFGISTRTNQINWVREIKSSDGDTTQETLTSTYSRFYRK
jgi:vancomycin resistance protein YoaR